MSMTQTSRLGFRHKAPDSEQLPNDPHIWQLCDRTAQKSAELRKVGAAFIP